MMNGHGKSDDAIVAGKPTNKADQTNCGAVRGGAIRRGVGGAKGGGQGEYGPAKHAPDTESGERVTSAGTYTASSKGKA